MEGYDEEDYGDEFVDLGDLQDDLKLEPGGFKQGQFDQKIAPKKSKNTEDEDMKNIDE